MSEAKLYDARGNEIKTRTIPVVKFRNFVFPIELSSKEDYVDLEKPGVTPGAIVRELRARNKELYDRNQLLMAMMALLAMEGPSAVAEFLNSAGAVISDANGNILFKPETEEN